MLAGLRVVASVMVALAIGLALPVRVAAATVAELEALAEGPPYNMYCSPSEDGGITCSAASPTDVASWYAVIKPGSGQEESLQTYAQVYGQTAPGLDPESRAWMADMHAAACGAPSKVADFVDRVGSFTQVGQALGPASIGTCTLTGSLDAAIEGPPSYHVGSEYVAPPPPTPTPEPMPTPTSTPEPTPKPTKRPTPPPSEPATAASPSVAPSASADAAATEQPPTFIPTQEVAAATDVPDESLPPPEAPLPPPQAPLPPPQAPPGAPSFPDVVRTTTAINTDPGAIGGSVLLAVLLLLVVGFAGELFNNTVENNYDVIAGWLGRGPIARLNGWLSLDGRLGVALFVALTALVSAFVDPSFGLDLRSLAEFLGFLIGLIVVLASFKLPPMLAHRRATGELGRLRPLPWALVIAALFVLVSRLGNLQPGYLYGIVLGAIFVREVSDREEGRETLYGSAWTLATALLGWLGLTWLGGPGLDPDGFGATLLATAFGAIVVAGLEATAFGLMPMRFMPGYALYRWNRPAWAVLFGVSVFAFVHILAGPTSGYVSELDPAAFAAALGVFAAFGALSIATWLYFRFRTAPETAS